RLRHAQRDARRRAGSREDPQALGAGRSARPSTGSTPARGARAAGARAFRGRTPLRATRAGLAGWKPRRAAAAPAKAGRGAAAPGTRTESPVRVRCLCASLPSAGALAAPALAEDLSDLPLTADGPAIDHGDADIDDALHARPDPDRVDTMLVFTNLGPLTAAARCVAFDRGGDVAGHGHAVVPARGARIVLASDLVPDRGFAGHVQCGAARRVVGSAFLLAPGGISAAPAEQSDRPGRGDLRIVFPVVAHF